MNEAETRAELIDPKLKACGWWRGASQTICRKTCPCNAYSTNGREIYGICVQTGGIILKMFMIPPLYLKKTRR